MTEKTTLKHPTLRPHIATSSNPTTITQLKSQGYRVVTDDEEIPNVYDGRKAGDLKDEITRRNEDRDPEGEDYIRPEGRSREAFQSALEADDAAQADAADGGDGDGAGDGAGEGGGE